MLLTVIVLLLPQFANFKFYRGAHVIMRGDKSLKVISFSLDIGYDSAPNSDHFCPFRPGLLILLYLQVYSSLYIQEE